MNNNFLLLLVLCYNRLLKIGSWDRLMDLDHTFVDLGQHRFLVLLSHCLFEFLGSRRYLAWNERHGFESLPRAYVLARCCLFSSFCSHAWCHVQKVALIVLNIQRKKQNKTNFINFLKYPTNIFQNRRSGNSRTGNK